MLTTYERNRILGWIIFLLVVLMIYDSCKKIKYTIDIGRAGCNCKLYVQVYSSGILGSLTSEYLTDSTHFRLYAGTFDDESGHISYNCVGDSIIIEKRERTNEVFKLDTSYENGKFKTNTIFNYDLKITDVKKYKLSELKK